MWRLSKKVQRNIHQNFINYVKERRSDSLTQDEDILFNGEFWDGSTALEYGLIDGINDVYSFLEEKYGDDLKIVHMEQKHSLIKRLFTSKMNYTGEINSQISSNIDQLADTLTTNFINKVKDEILDGKYANY